MIKALIKPLERHWLVALLVLTGVLAPQWIAQISGERIASDGAANARMAVNLVHHGVISHEEHDTPAPTMYREPLPAASAALGVLIADRLLGRGPTAEYLHGDRARYLKYHQVPWKAVSVFGTYALIFLLSSSHVAALLGAALLGTRPDLGSALTTELEAGALLVCGLALFIAGNRLSSRLLKKPLVDAMQGESRLESAAYTGVREHFEPAFNAAARRQRLFLQPASRVLVGSAGLTFGLLALTKAAFLYVFIGFVAIVPFVFALRDRRSSGFASGTVQLAAVRRSLPTVAILVGAFAAVTLPWMMRNYIHFGAFEISGRSGIVLYTRAVKNRMTPEEFRGSFYAWSPWRVRDLVGRLTGFDESDLALGGRLQRFNRAENSEFAPLDEAAEQSGRPEAALTYYREARAERVRLIEKHSATLPRAAAELAADDELKVQALAAFAAAPFKHLVVSIPFIWRGAGLLVPVLLVALVIAWRKTDRALLLVVLTASGYILFHALLTHFESRFATPLKPVMAALGLVIAAELGRTLLAWRSSGRLARPAQV